MSAQDPAIRRLAPGDAPALLAFFDDLTDRDRALFHPHGFEREDAARVCRADRADLYVAGWQADHVAAYGMLRGWDEGHAIPRLGLAVRPACRGRGWARRMMQALHALARHAGAPQVELTVEAENAPARGLYDACGYVFAPGPGGRLLGRKAL